MHIAAKAGKRCKNDLTTHAYSSTWYKTIKKPMHIAANGGKRYKHNQKTHVYSSIWWSAIKKTMNIATKILKNSKKNMSIAAKMKRTQHRRSSRRSTSYRSGHQRWETLLSHTPTQLRLARSLARTTRTRNETETDFPIGGQLRRLFPLNLRYSRQ